MVIFVTSFFIDQNAEDEPQAESAAAQLLAEIRPLPVMLNCEVELLGLAVVEKLLDCEEIEETVLAED